MWRNRQRSQRWGRGKNKGNGDALHNSGSEQQGKGGRQAAQQHGDGAGAQTPAQDAAVTPHVGDLATAEQQAGIGQDIADHDPLHGGDIQAKVGRNRREGDIHGRIERDQHGAGTGDKNRGLEDVARHGSCPERADTGSRARYPVSDECGKSVVTLDVPFVDSNRSGP